jgi:hypothetical protein
MLSGSEGGTSRHYPKKYRLEAGIHVLFLNFFGCPEIPGESQGAQVQNLKIEAGKRVRFLKYYDAYRGKGEAK